MLLRANDSFIGNLGLMQRLDVRPPRRRPNAKAQAGQPILVFNVADLDQRWPRIAATPGVQVESTPHPVEYPAAGGGRIPVTFAALWDPDGFYVETNRLHGTPAGASTAAPPQR